MAQPNIDTVVNHLQGMRDDVDNHLQGIQDEMALIPNIPAAGGALQQQFNVSKINSMVSRINSMVSKINSMISNGRPRRTIGSCFRFSQMFKMISQMFKMSISLYLRLTRQRTQPSFSYKLWVLAWEEVGLLYGIAALRLVLVGCAFLFFSLHVLCHYGSRA
jgi:hypothetical protein